MLPDIPQLKNVISTYLSLAVNRRMSEYLGVIGHAPRQYVKEGDRIIIRREDGSIDESNMQSAKGETVIEHNELSSLDAKSRLERIDNVAKQLAKQFNQYAFERINEAVEQIGNVVDGKNLSTNPEVILDLYEKVHIDFDEEGNPDKISLVIPPGKKEEFDKAFKALQENSKYVERYNEIISRKRVEWRDREASRRLVG